MSFSHSSLCETSHFSSEDEELIFPVIQFLFSDGPWKKSKNKDAENSFDVSMGSWDGAEVCEATNLFILNHIVNVKGMFKNEEVGIYRDDGLAIVRGTARSVDVLRKKLEQIFKEELGLKITAEFSACSTDFLDVILDLKSGLHRPFRKANDTPNYIHVNSNHPPAVIKQIPTMIEDRLSTNSSNEEIFKAAAGIYQDALERSGYSHKLTYKPKKAKKEKRRQRKILWWNPPPTMHPCQPTWAICSWPCWTNISLKDQNCTNCSTEVMSK